MLYRRLNTRRTSIKGEEGKEGETIEAKVRRIVNNKEPIQDGAPLVYTERKDGVRPEYDIRTDRFEIAIDATDRMTRERLAKRDESLTIGEQAKEGMAKEGNGDSNEVAHKSGS